MPPSEERRIRLTLHYDGREFFGWQRQPNARTVQGELERALSRLTNRGTDVIAAGRTDRGVHAVGQVVSARVPARWRAAELGRALNAVLPADVWVRDAREVPLEFHARYGASARAYVYRVGTAPLAASPLHRRWCWPLGESLDRGVLERAAGHVVGDRSFRSFAKAGQPERGERCHVMAARWLEWPRLGLAFHITADRFLHHMVRYLVGTMVHMARGRRDPDDMERLLSGAAGFDTSDPAPPEGLFLARVYYPDDELQSEDAIDEDLP